MRTRKNARTRDDDIEQVETYLARQRRVGRREGARRRQASELERRPCVLVAEDDADIRTLVTAALRRDGYDVIAVTNGAELLARIGSSMLFGETAPPDLIVSDIRMPGFSGLTALKGVRSADSRVPFVLITAYGDEKTREEALRLGVNAIFDKPFDIDDLRTAIWNMVPSGIG